MSAIWRSVILSPLGTPFTYWVDRVIERKEPLVRGLEQKGGGEGLGDAAYPVVHIGRHRLPRSSVSHPKGAHPRVLWGLHGGHHPGRVALFERLLQCRFKIGLGCLFATSVGMGGIPFAAITPLHPLPIRSTTPVTRSSPFHIDRCIFWTNKPDSFQSAIDRYIRTGRNPGLASAPTFPNASSRKASSQYPAYTLPISLQAV